MVAFPFRRYQIPDNVGDAADNTQLQSLLFQLPLLDVGFQIAGRIGKSPVDSQDLVHRMAEPGQGLLQ